MKKNSTQKTKRGAVVSLAQRLRTAIHTIAIESETLFHKIPKRHSRVLNVAYYALPILLLTIALVHIISVAGLGYDDAYNLQVSQNIAKRGIYATNGAVFYGKPVLFDYHITTGPTLLIPIALFIKLFGSTIIASRIVPILVLIAFFAVLYLYLRQLVASKKIDAHLLFAAYVLLASLVFALGSIDNLLFSSVGELLGLTFLLSGGILLKKYHLFSSGLLIGLAVLTKTIYAMAIPITLLLVYAHTQGGLKQKILAIAKNLSGIIVPALLFEIYRLYSFNFNFADYRANINEFLLFFRQSGSGIDAMSSTALGIIKSRVAILIGASPVFRNVASVLAILFISAAISWYAYRQFKKIKIPPGLKNICTNTLVSFVGCTGFIWLAWWIVASNYPFYRHVFGAMVLLQILFIGIMLLDKRIVAHIRPIAAAMYTIGLMVIVVNAYSFTYQFGGATEQVNSAKVIQAYYKDKQLYHYGWWQNPEIQYLNEITSQPYTAEHHDAHVLISDVQKRFDSADYRALEAKCDNLTILTARYRICVIK